VLCIQETKFGRVDDYIVSFLWGNNLCGYSFQLSVGVLGGMFTVWDSVEVEVRSTMSFENSSVIKGRFLRSEKRFGILNVYAP